MNRSRFLLFLLPILITCTARAQREYGELYRPQIHFSPKAKWMNDPNGMLYYNDEFHLFFQYNPDSTVWGPMHWGHAVSKDLIHWEQLPIALYPDSNGTIFSGSVVIDSSNSSGFGSNGVKPMIAIFTQFNAVREKAGTADYQNQGLAYSLDNGRKWIKYAENPVLKTPGLKDFRDPKLMWMAETGTWIMTLAAGDQILFYSSTDLKHWTAESAFGKNIGAHGGVWECPDLIPFTVDGKKIWTLLVSVNPGGVQGGSGTQYFTGSFDGHHFSTTDTITKWIDYGPDDYAGVTFSNTGSRKVFMGWMNNWSYAADIPSSGWRGSMTIPRELSLKSVNGRYFLAMFPVYELHKMDDRSLGFREVPLDKLINPPAAGKLNSLFRIDMTADRLRSFSFTFSNLKQQEVVVGYDEVLQAFYIDRSRAGKTDFSKTFGARHSAARIARKQAFQCTILVDAGSVELFADDGLLCMTETFFVTQPLNHFVMKAEEGYKASDFRITTLKSIWR